MCGDSGFDDSIDSILVTHPDRVARQQHQADDTVFVGIDLALSDDTITHWSPPICGAGMDVDLADSYVPFDSSADAADKKASEEYERINSGRLALIVVGTIFGLLTLMDYIAKGEAIPPVKAVSFASGR